VGWNEPWVNSLTFDVALHLGTLIAILAYFGADWWRLIRAGLHSLGWHRPRGNNSGATLFWLLVIGTIPGAIAGVLFEHQVETVLRTPWIIAILMIGVGLLLLLMEGLATHRRPLESVDLADAMVVGLAQALAIAPGVSRSGITIAAGLGMNLKREAAARFSFLLAAPVIFGAGVKQVWNLREVGIAADERLPFVVGLLAAAITGYLAIAFLLHYLRRRSLAIFVWYRLLAGAGVLAWVGLGH